MHWRRCKFLCRRIVCLIKVGGCACSKVNTTGNNSYNDEYNKSFNNCKTRDYLSSHNNNVQTKIRYVN